MWPTILIALGFAATTAKTVNGILKNNEEKRPKKDKKNTEKGLDDVQA